MENITTDIHDLEKGMEVTKREFDMRRSSRDQSTILKDFLANSEDKLRKLLSDVKTAQVNCCGYSCVVKKRCFLN